MKKYVNYFAQGPFCWGIGGTEDEAVKLARQNWPGPPYTKIERRKARKEMFSIWRLESDSKITIDVDGDRGGFSYDKVNVTVEQIQTSTLSR